MAAQESPTLGELLRRYRVAAGLSQEALAERAGLSARTVSDLERGEKQAPHRETVRLLATALNLGPDERTVLEVAILRRRPPRTGPPPRPTDQGSGQTRDTHPVPFVYLSYAQADRAFAARLGADLRARGVGIWSDDQGLQPGTANWEQALRDAIRAAQTVLLLASPHTRTSRYVMDELRVAEMYGRPVCPVWVAGAQWMDCMPLGWGGLQHVDARGPAYEEALHALLATLRTASVPGVQSFASTVTPTAPETPPRNPYKGLRAFQPEDAGDFFGRDSLIAALVTAVGTHSATGARFVAVVGPSGAGKSSAVLAGLLPRLRAGGLPGSTHWVYLPPLMPGAHPLEALSITLNDAIPHSSLAAIRSDLEDSERGLHLLAARLVSRPEDRVVLVVDQAEELFTLTNDEGERRHVIDLLVTAATEPRGALLVLLTLRADFYDRPLRYIQLGRLVDTQSVAVLPLALAELRAAITGPAELPDVGVRFEGDLVGDLLFEVQGQAGALPLLQFTLDQLFERRDGHLLTAAAYHEMGGVRGALARQAEATYLSLPGAEHRTLARALFLRTIEPGATAQDTTRRRVPWADLELADPPRTARMHAVVEAFVGARLLTATESGGTTVLEVSHEALIREWARLGAWLHETREDVRLQGRLSADAAAWERRGCPVDSLYRGTVLAEAEGWAARNTPSAREAAFLAAAAAEGQRQEVAERERQARELALAQQAATRLRTLVGVLVLFLTAAAGLTAVALLNAQQASANAHKAQVAQQREASARALALSRQLAAQALNHLSHGYDLSLLLSVEARHIADTVEARGSLLAGLEMHPTGLSALLWAHGVIAKNLAASPDGRLVAWTTFANTIQLWDVAHRRPLGPPLSSHLHGMSDLAFSADGRTLLARGYDRKSVERWDVAQRRLISPAFMLPGPITFVEAVALSPDGKTVAFSYGMGAPTGGNYNSISTYLQLWDIARGRLLATLASGHWTSNLAADLAFSPDGKTLAAATYDGTIELWEIARHRRRAVFGGHSVGIGPFAFSPDGGILASMSRSTIQLWDVRRGQPLGAPLAGHTNDVTLLAFSPDSALLASAATDNTIRLWDVRQRRALGPPLDSHTGEPFGLVFGARGARLFATNNQGTIAEWAVVQTVRGVSRLHGTLAFVGRLAFSPDGRTLYVGGGTLALPLAQAQLWDVARRQPDPRWSRGLSGSQGAFSRDGTLLVTAGAGIVRVWDAHRARLIKYWKSQTPANSMALSPEGTMVAVGDIGHPIELWDLRHQTLLRPMLQNQHANLENAGALAFSPDGKTLAVGWSDGTLWLWDVAHRRLLGTLLADRLGFVNIVAFSPDGALLATAGGDYAVHFWNVACRCASGVPLQGANDVGSLAFSPDGGLLATGGADGTVRLWDVATRQPMGLPLQGETARSSAVAFSPDGKLLAAGWWDGFVQLWDMDLASWPARACRLANRNLAPQEWRQYLGDLPYHATCPGLPAGA